MATNKLDKSFKTLINKRFTTDQRSQYSELGIDTLNIHAREVWTSEINTDPVLAALALIVVKYELSLTPDTYYPEEVFYLQDGPGHDPLVDPPNESYQISGLVSDKYGSDYVVKLFDQNDTVIPLTDDISWFFDYVTGVLNVADYSEGSYSLPYKVTVYKYIGKTLAEQSQGTTYIHDQGTASNTWVITHDLNKYPSITVVDSANTVIHGNSVYDSNAQVTLTFSASFTGKAYLN